jgi:bidirectional [NiFe] hydrogenase diaphorase subunit
MSVKTLKINDIDVSGRQDESILDIARENDIFIPTLCHIDGLTSIGACRMCLVEVAGSNKLLPACVTQVQEGMEVFTHSERLEKYRRMILEMLFVEGNHVCAVCVANGNCELQSLAEHLGIDHTRLDYRFPDKGVDASHYRYAIDHNRCILCARCVRVCGEIEGAHTWDVAGRGINATIVTDLNTPWAESDTCTECGKCIQVCPTGALFKKSRAVGEMVKDDQFLPYLKTMREVDNAR